MKKYAIINIRLYVYLKQRILMKNKIKIIGLLILSAVCLTSCNTTNDSDTAEAVNADILYDIDSYDESITESQQINMKNEKIIPVTYINQNPDFPSGCEGCSAVMLMSYYGVIITPDTFFDKYLPISGKPFDPDLTYGGNPRDLSGRGCYAPVLAKAMNRILEKGNLEAKIIPDKSMQELCSEYIDNNIPVIIWGSIDMAKVHTNNVWTYNNKTIVWRSPEHCLVLTGYDDDNYIFNDPVKGKNTRFPKDKTEDSYNDMRRQAIIIEKDL